MKILALLLIAFALTGGELADSPLQQRVLALKNALRDAGVEVRRCDPL